MATSLKLIDNIIDYINAGECKQDSAPFRLFEGKFHEIIDTDTERIGLFIKYKIGSLSDSDFACFGAACGDGFGKLNKYFKENKLFPYFDPYALDITPDPPSPDKNARFYVGYFIDSKYKNDEQQIEKIRKYETAIIKMEKLKPNKWFVYRYRGSYDYLTQGWKAAINMFHERGYQRFDQDCYFEQYRDLEHENVEPKDLITDIYIGIA